MWTILIDIFLMSFQKGRTPATVVAVLAVIVLALAVITILRNSVV